MSNEVNLKECPACGVKIENGAKVLFSCGQPGTLERLYARVCQFAKRPGCINKGGDELELKEEDYYN